MSAGSKSDTRCSRHRDDYAAASCVSLLYTHAGVERETGRDCNDDSQAAFARCVCSETTVALNKPRLRIVYLASRKCSCAFDALQLPKVEQHIIRVK